jgi:hypothetical protein
MYSKPGATLFCRRGSRKGLGVSNRNTAVVAHYLDGRVLKGNTQDFSPQQPNFHILPLDGSRGVHVLCRDLKAIFFVKDFAGDPKRADLRGFISGPAETTQGRKIAVRFEDTELLCGYSISYLPRRGGFFIAPADSGSNNQRIFVITSGAAEICEGKAAEQLVQRVLDSMAA